MKADEKKENVTNSLRLWLEHVTERLKGRALYTVVGSIVLVVAVIFVVWYWTSSRVTAKSARLLEFTQADTEKKLTEIISADNHQNKPTAVWAKLEKARIVLYREGIDRLGSLRKEDHIAAVDKVEEGRKLYSELLNELKDEALKQEAYWSIARSEEVLSATPKADKATEYRGSLDKAIDNYLKASQIDAGSEASKSYAAKAKSLQENKGAIETFYRKLEELGFTAPLLPEGHPPVPKFRPPFGP